MYAVPPSAKISCRVSSSCSSPRATSSTVAPRRGQQQRRRPADAARGAGDQHRLAGDRARDAACIERVRGPGCAPSNPRACRRSSSSGGTSIPDPASACARAFGVELGRQVDVVDDLVGDADLGEQRPARGVRAGQRHQRPRRHRAARFASGPGIDRDGELRRCGDLRERVQHVDQRAIGFGSVRWKACPSRPGWWAM